MGAAPNKTQTASLVTAAKATKPVAKPLFEDGEPFPKLPAPVATLPKMPAPTVPTIPTIPVPTPAPTPAPAPKVSVPGLELEPFDVRDGKVVMGTGAKPGSPTAPLPQTPTTTGKAGVQLGQPTTAPASTPAPTPTPAPAPKPAPAPAPKPAPTPAPVPKLPAEVPEIFVPDPLEKRDEKVVLGTGKKPENPTAPLPQEPTSTGRAGTQLGQPTTTSPASTSTDPGVPKAPKAAPDLTDELLRKWGRTQFLSSRIGQTRKSTFLTRQSGSSTYGKTFLS